ncbi:MAG: hypothetical protein FWG12_02165 [Holophagaceae bacterium]|nr:hypothetical protein [Holophagaceae bacterium]
MLLSAMAVADGSCSDNILKSTTLNRQVPWTNARANAGQWYFGIYGNSPEFSGHYLDQGSEKTNFDLNNSLYMDTEKTGYGLHMEYSGSRFAFSVDYGIQDYTGNNRLERQVEINNIIFVPGMDVTSSLKNTAFDINGTIKLLRGAQAWLGVDVGIQAWYMDLVASGVHTFLPIAPAEANKSIVVSIPQIGISGNFQGLQNRLVINGRAHFMALKGASSNRFSADARYFFLHWLGGRVFWEQQNHDEPYDSMHKNIEQKYERKGIGFGVVARW